MFLRKLGDTLRNTLKHQTVLDGFAAVFAQDIVSLIDFSGLASNLEGTALIKPNVLSDPEHPAIEPCPFFPLIEPRQSASARLLNKIVALIRVSGQSVGEPTQARQKFDD